MSALASAVAMPRLVYGTAWKAERTAELVETALRRGFRGIDTACQPKHYNEAGVGEGVARAGIPREQLFLQTKFTPLSGQDPLRIPYDKNASLSDQVAQSFAVSQKNLRTAYVDSLVLHSPLQRHQDLMQVWRAMERIHSQGGAKQLGISNCYDIKVLHRLFEEASVKPTVVQNRFYKDSGYDVGIREYCSAKGITYQSFWTLTANPHLLKHNTIKEAARKLGRTEAQILFRYLTQCGIMPLTGTTSVKHMDEDLAIFDFDLPSDVVQAISALL